MRHLIIIPPAGHAVLGDSTEEDCGKDWPLLAVQLSTGWWVRSHFIVDDDQAGLPIVWDGRIHLPNCDRVVREYLKAAPGGWSSHHPVRNYDTDDVLFYAERWAHRLGWRVVVVDNDCDEGEE